MNVIHSSNGRIPSGRRGRCGFESHMDNKNIYAEATQLDRASVFQDKKIIFDFQYGWSGFNAEIAQLVSSV